MDTVLFKNVQLVFKLNLNSRLSTTFTCFCVTCNICYHIVHCYIHQTFQKSTSSKYHRSRDGYCGIYPDKHQLPYGHVVCGTSSFKRSSSGKSLSIRFLIQPLVIQYYFKLLRYRQRSTSFWLCIQDNCARTIYMRLRSSYGGIEASFRHLHLKVLLNTHHLYSPYHRGICLFIMSVNTMLQ